MDLKESGGLLSSSTKYDYGFVSLLNSCLCMYFTIRDSRRRKIVEERVVTVENGSAKMGGMKRRSAKMGRKMANEQFSGIKENSV